MAPTRREFIQAGAAAGALAAFGPAGRGSGYTPGPSIAAIVARGTPMQLSASGTINPGAEGGVNSLALMNPNAGPMEIDAIKVRVKIITPLNTVGSYGAMNPGGTAAISLGLGKMPLTNGPIPVWLLGRATNVVAEQQAAVGGTDKNLGIAEFRWKLARPMWVPPGHTVIPKILHRGALAASLEAYVTYEARALPEGSAQPRIIHVPFATHWSSKSFACDATKQTDVSRETDLVNPFDVPLHVTRMTGRLPVISVVIGNPAVDEQLIPDSNDNVVKLRMVASDGEPVIRYLSPFRLVFDRVARSWECPHEMMPHAYYTAYVTMQDIASTDGPTFLSQGGSGVQAQIGIVGYRDVSGDLTAVLQ